MKVVRMYCTVCENTWKNPYSRHRNTEIICYSMLALDKSVFLLGCTLEEHTNVEIIRHSGESVLLPCSCSPLHVKPERVHWEFFRGIGSQYDRVITVSNTSGPYRGRIQMFNHLSPGNASLLIPDLSEKDQGLYRCYVSKQFWDIRLLVKGQ